MIPAGRGNALDWTPEMLATLRAMRANGQPLLVCAERIGVDYKTAVRKARKLGLADRMNRGARPGWKIKSDHT